MRSLYTPVPLQLIDLEDRSFEVQSFAACDQLEASLERSGILVPPWLLETDGGRLIVVDGFKRLRWQKGSGGRDIECFVFPRESDRPSLLLLRAEGKTFGPPLNVAEKARIISMLGRVFPRELITDRFLPALGVHSRNDAVDRWTALATSGETLLVAVASAVVSDRAALELANWEREVTEKMVLLLGTLRCSASIQMEIVERIQSIGRQQSRDLTEILLEPELQAILSNPGSNHRQKTQSVRDLLTGWAFPRLSAREDRFAREVREASLPESIRLVHPPAFEGERWQLQLAFSTPEGLLSLLEKAGILARSSLLPKLMAPVSDE